MGFVVADVDKNVFSLLNRSEGHLGNVIDSWMKERLAKQETMIFGPEMRKQVFFLYDIPRGRIRGCSLQRMQGNDSTGICMGTIEVHADKSAILQIALDSVHELCRDTIKETVRKYNELSIVFARNS